MDAPRFAERYRVLRALGEGGTGVVYLAEDAVAARLVAIKHLRAERLTAAAQTSMRREFMVLTRLRHPNLVEVYDFYSEPQLYFTMEHVEGVDLRSAELEGDALVGAVVEVCRALEYVHGRGLAHLDIKPSNILVARAGGRVGVKLTDFGVASETGAASGYTVGFVAPEIVEGRGFDGRADLYSLGMTLLALREPHRPLASDVTLQVRGSGSASPPLGPADTGHLPAALAAVVERLVRVDPSERFGSASQVIEAVGAPLDSPATRVGSVQGARLTGRAVELERLVARYAEVRAGGSAHVVVEGAAGMGKSRLSAELRVHVQLDGGLVAVGAAASGAPGLRPVAQIVAQLGAGLGDLALSAAAAGGLESTPARSRLTEAVLARVAAAATARPLLIVVEDVHWLDDASAQLIGALRRRQLPRVLLVTTTRGSADPGADVIRLGPIAARALVEDALGPGAVPESFLERAAELSGGNALYVSELLKLCVDRELVVRRPGGGWTGDARALAAAALPASIAELVAERIRLLPLALRRLAWSAALLGGSVDPAVLEEAHGEGARADLADLAGRQLLVAEGRRFRFSHPELEAGARVDARGAGEQSALERRLAAALERRGADPADVARLWLDAGDPARALPHLVRAGAAAETVLDHGSAVVAYDRALALASGPLVAELHLRRLGAIRRGGLGDVPLDEDAARAAAGDDPAVRLELARVLTRRGRYVEALAEADAARARARDDRARAEAERAAGMALYHLGALPAALARLDGAVALGGEAAALNDRGLVHGYAGDFAAALADHEQALAQLAAAPDRLDALADTRNDLGFAAWNLGRYDDARAHLDEALALRRRLADVHGEGVTRNNIGNVLRHQGRLEAARAEYQAALALCRRSGNALHEAVALNNLGQIEEEQGRVEAAAALYREALALATRLGDRIREGDNLGNLGALALGAGRPDEAEAWLARAVDVRRGVGDRAYLVLDLSHLALARLAQGRGADARAAIAEALDLVAAGQEGIEQVQAVFVAGHRVLAALGEDERAAALLRRAVETVRARAAALADPAPFLALRVNREILELGTAPAARVVLDAPGRTPDKDRDAE